MMNLAARLKQSLNEQAAALERTLVLSPTETLPLARHLYPPNIEKVVNLYPPDSFRSKQDKLIFGGRDRITGDFLEIYRTWAKALRAAAVSMRPLGGLHSHTILFAGLKQLGETVLLVPEEAGGHFATEKMLTTLGLKVVKMPIDCRKYDIDFRESKRILQGGSIDFVFFDRSEGLNYTDVTPLLRGSKAYSIFDASHFLSNILVGDYKNPFDMGFDMCVATMHKSLPGPQKAMLFTKREDRQWAAVVDASRTFVSNVHPAGIYAAGMIVSDLKFLRRYSRMLIANAAALEGELANLGLPIIRRRDDVPGSYFIWIAINNQDRAYQIFQNLLEVGIETNYRLLAYNLGYGIRLGTPIATLFGLQPKNAKELAAIFADVYFNGASAKAAKQVRAFLKKIKANRLDR